MIEIESGVPEPRERSWNRRVSEEMKGMKVGESVVVDYHTMMALAGWLVRHGGRVKREKVDYEAGMYRVWRVG